MDKDTLYLSHMHSAIEKLQAYVEGHTFEEFETNDWDQDAVLRNLSVLGEAANKVSDSYRTNHPEVNWRDLIDLRNVVIHDYMNVDLGIIWNIVARDIGELKEILGRLD